MSIAPTKTIAYREAMREAIREALLADERVFLMGEDVETLERAAGDKIEAAIEFAEAGTFEPVEDLERFVYWDPAHPEPATA